MQYIQGNIILNVEKTGNVKYFSLPKTIEFFLRSFERSSRNLLEFEVTSSRLFSLRLMFDRSKLESLRDVSVTRIGDTLSYSFPQTELM